jgi:hypothetical protein
MNIDFPFKIDHRGRSAETGDSDHIRDLIEQLLFTMPGERVNRPDFGSGLMHLVFGPNSSEVAAALQFTMQASLQKWLGDLIDVQKLELTSVDGALYIDLVYFVRRTGEARSDTFSLEPRHES